MVKDESVGRIFWSAIIAGAIGGLGLNFLLNLLSLSIGISIFSVNEMGKTVFSLLGLTSFVISAIIAMFGAGWITGILSTIPNKNASWGFLYGFVTWCLSLIITTILLTNMIQFASFHSNFTSHPDLVSIRITNDQPMMTETKSANKSEKGLADVEYKKKIINLNSGLTFLIFLIGSISSCFGGFVGAVQQGKKRKHK